MTFLIANPACLAAYAPHNYVGEEVMDGVAEVGDVIICLRVIDGALGCAGLAAVATCVVATRRTVKPHLKLLVAILGKLHALRKEHLLGIVVRIAALAV